MGEKTEKATPKKRRDARKKGQVAVSKELPAALTFATSFAAVVLSSKTIYQNLVGFMLSMFANVSSHDNIVDKLPSSIMVATNTILTTSLPFMIIVSFVGVITSFLIVGPLFSMQALKPDIKRMNPITNIKNKFKMKTIVELLKSIIKIIGAVLLTYSVVRGGVSEIVSTASLSVLGTAVLFSSFLTKVAIRVGIFFIVISIFDLIFQKKNFEKEIRMEKFELKREHKDTEGNPEIKSQRRRRQYELSYRDGPTAARRARGVVTNPTHIAVAFGYNSDDDPAPKILVMGIAKEAEKIIEVAIECGVPVIRNPPLARDLYNKGEIGEYIPESTYDAVAEVLWWIESMESEPEYNVKIFE